MNEQAASKNVMNQARAKMNRGEEEMGGSRRGRISMVSLAFSWERLLEPEMWGRDVSAS